MADDQAKRREELRRAITCSCGALCAILEDGIVWPEAEIVAEPIPEKRLTEPRVLVRRRLGSLIGPNGEELVYVPGPPAISLFTGCGGMDIGVEEAGFVTLLQVERWDAACATLLANRPQFFRHAGLLQADIATLPTETILEHAGVRVGECWLVCGGPPCQGFSTAGRRRPKDERNDLVFAFLRVVRQAQPRTFVFENVPGFTSFNGGAYMAAFLEAAYDGFYEVVYGLLNASSYGVPQDRVRFLAVGTRRDVVAIDGQLAALPKPAFFSNEDLRAASLLEKRFLDPAAVEELTLIEQAPGIRYFPGRPVLKPPRPTGRDGVSPGFKKFFARLRAEEPDRIVT